MNFLWLLSVIYYRTDAQITSLTWSDLCKPITYGSHCNMTSQRRLICIDHGSRHAWSLGLVLRRHLQANHLVKALTVYERKWRCASDRNWTHGYNPTIDHECLKSEFDPRSIKHADPIRNQPTKIYSKLFFPIASNVPSSRLFKTSKTSVSIWLRQLLNTCIHTLLKSPNYRAVQTQLQSSLIKQKIKLQ